MNVSMNQFWLTLISVISDACYCTCLTVCICKCWVPPCALAFLLVVLCTWVIFTLLELLLHPPPPLFLWFCPLHLLPTSSAPSPQLPHRRHHRRHLLHPSERPWTFPDPFRGSEKEPRLRHGSVSCGPVRGSSLIKVAVKFQRSCILYPSLPCRCLAFIFITS